jgi:hypothetical protein
LRFCNRRAALDSRHFGEVAGGFMEMGMAKDDNNSGPGGGNSGPGNGDGPGNSGPGGGGGPGHGGDNTVTIVINGVRKPVAKNAVLSFDQLVRLAFENPQTGDGAQYTINYTRGPDGHRSGSLVEGQTVPVKDGMEFDVTPTNRS